MKIEMTQTSQKSWIGADILRSKRGTKHTNQKNWIGADIIHTKRRTKPRNPVDKSWIGVNII